MKRTFTPEQKEAQRKYAAAYYKANADRIKRRVAKYYVDNHEAALAQQTAYRKANPEKVRAAVNAWHAAHPEKVRKNYDNWLARNPGKPREHRARYYAKNKKAILTKYAERRLANREKENKRIAEWARLNPEKRSAAKARRRAREYAGAVPLTPQEQAKVIGIYAEARALTEMIGTPYHVDHIIPLAKGGLHHPNNLQILRAVDNLRKGAKL